MHSKVFAGSSSSYLLYRKVDAFAVNNTITVSPTMIVTAGFGFNRFPNNTLDISNGFDQTTLGFPTSYVSALQKKAFPQITNQSLATEGTLELRSCRLLLAQLRSRSFEIARQA